MMFLEPAWLLLLPFAWGLVWLVSGKRSPWSGFERLFDPRLWERLAPTADASGSRVPWVLLALVTAGILAASGPSWRSKATPLLEPAASRVLLLDLSRSMLVEDLEPNRHVRARDVIRALVESGFPGETALVAFAGAPFLVSPLTRDRNALLGMLAALTPATMPVDGSRIDLAIVKAEQLLAGSLTGTGEIVVVSDGARFIEESVEAAQQALARGNPVTVVAVGSTSGAPLRDEKGRLVKTDDGALIIHRTDPEALSRIAAVGGGRFVHLAATGRSLSTIVAETGMDQPEVAPGEMTEVRVNGGIWLVWLMLPIALLLFRRQSLWVFVALALIPADKPPYAGDWNWIWQNKERLAYQAYLQGDYERVHDLSGDPALRGTAYYQTKEYQRASDLLARSASTTSLYNLGNALAFQEKFTEAVAAYERALALDPDFSDARHNKNLVENYLEQEATGVLGDSVENAEGDESANMANPRGGEASSSNSIGAGGDEQEGGSQAGVGSGLGEDSPGDESVAVLKDEPGEQTYQPPQGTMAAAEERRIDLWLGRLPDDPSELFRRKFLRDHLLETGDR